jgi:hypothetical protein
VGAPKVFFFFWYFSLSIFTVRMFNESIQSPGFLSVSTVGSYPTFQGVRMLPVAKYFASHEHKDAKSKSGQNGVFMLWGSTERPAPMQSHIRDEPVLELCCRLPESGMSRSYRIPTKCGEASCFEKYASITIEC